MNPANKRNHCITMTSWVPDPKTHCDCPPKGTQTCPVLSMQVVLWTLRITKNSFSYQVTTSRSLLKDPASSNLETLCFGFMWDLLPLGPLSKVARNPFNKEHCSGNSQASS